MRNESAAHGEALTAAVQEMLAMADEIEAQAQAWAEALETLGEERAARLRRKAYELNMRRRPTGAPSTAGVAAARAALVAASDDRARCEIA